MTRKPVDSSLEKQFITAMIVHTPFLASMATSMDTALLQTKWVQVVASWCIKYFKQYAAAPGKSIEPLYHSWVANEQPSTDDSEAVHDFLSTLSHEYETTEQMNLYGAEINVPFLLDEVAKYLTTRRMTQLSDTLATHLMSNQSDEGLRAIQEFRTVNVGDKVGYFPLKDKQMVRNAFKEAVEAVVKFPGDAELFFGQAFTRDALIGVQGPEKIGKTFWMYEFVYRALRGRKKVAYFQVGDLSRDQFDRRWLCRMAGVPLKRNHCTDLKIPRGIALHKDDTGLHAKIDYDIKSYATPLTLELGMQGQRQFRRTHKLTGTEVMFSCHAMNTVRVSDIHSILERWRYELEFVADLIIVDYADILAPEDPRLEFRHQVNATWKALRRLSQDWHACVVTPTQANAATYGQKTQGRQNFSEDKRKNAHLTGMLGLNQTFEEKEMGLMRLNWLFGREFDFNPERCLWVAQCIPLCQAFVRSVW